MQRKDIDEIEFADLRSGMSDPDTTGGTITVVTGTHPLYGALILVAAADAFAVLGNDVHLIVGAGETVESDLAATEPGDAPGNESMPYGAASARRD